MKRVWVVGVVLAASVAMVSCGARQKRSRSVTRLDANEQTDLSGAWNDTDAKLVSAALIKQCMGAGWLSSFVDEEGRKPAIRVRGIVNKTDEHIDAQVFIKNIEKALLNSSKVKVLAQDTRSERGSSTAERELAAKGELSDDSAPSLGNATGADFVVSVRMASILDQVEGKRAKFYKINMEMIHSTTDEKAWIGDYEIKKLVEQARATW